MSETISWIQTLLTRAKEIFRQKLELYGASWRYFRPIGIVDQIFIKAQRIRTIEESGKSQVGESIEDALFAILNYTIIGELLLSPLNDERDESILSHYDRITSVSLELLERKNTDYEEAWRKMDRRSLTDMILVKTARMKTILSRHKPLGEHEVQAVIDQLRDIRHYALFRMIHERYLDSQ